MQNQKRTIDQSLLSAQNHTTRTDFFKADQAAYAFLHRRGLLDSACAHMELSPVYSKKRWTRGEVFAEAAKYKNRAEFRRSNQGAYGYALSNGLIDQACANMRDGHNFWHLFELMAVAVKYFDFRAFKKAEPQAYNYANKNKLVGVACSHMSRGRTDWDKSAVMTEAAKHQQRGLFQITCPGAYKHADKHGYLDEACSHMPPPEYGFSKEKPANLYFLRISVPGVGFLYKIGITNRDPLARISGMGLFPGVTAEVIDVVRFDSGRDARIAEKRLHRKNSSRRYGGPPVMRNGNTELFTASVLEL